MNKKVKNYKLLGVIVILLIIFRNYLPSFPYTYNHAKNNGDVVLSVFYGNVNLNKFYTFLENVNNKTPDSIRVTMYTKEGDAVIADLKNTGKIIKCTYDTSRDSYGGMGKKIKVMEYTDIVLQNGSYYLRDSSGNNKDFYLFQQVKK